MPRKEMQTEERAWRAGLSIAVWLLTPFSLLNPASEHEKT